MRRIQIEKIKDKYGRPIISLRISITNRCNLKCKYCHHDGIQTKSPYEITPNEIYTICKTAKSLGIERIRLSGGEPLVRKDIIEIVEKIGTLNFRELTITTNGVLLEKYAEDLKKAGLNRVNISFDTQNSEKFKYLTTRDCKEDVEKGIHAANKAGLTPIKINMVVMKDINDDEIFSMFDFCKKHNIILQLIELLETDDMDEDDFIKKHHYEMTELEKELSELSTKITTRKNMQDRKKYFIDDGEIEIVKPIENTAFCQKCTRMRLTPEGKLKPCLLRNDNLIDMVKPLHEGADEKTIRELFIEGINKREPYYHK